jgi:YD repeat-containing protein
LTDRCWAKSSRPIHQSANCGSIWSQTFSADAFGNLTKSGTISFQPTYSTSTNRVTKVGNVTPGYDANGNLTSDGVHTYTWDADGNAVTIDSIDLTYDALDRMVEQNRSGSYTQIVYGPGGGKLALMSKQTLAKGFVPLAGGATAVYNSSGLEYYRHSDWLGTSRLASTASRTVYYDGAYAPYGENYAETGTQDRSNESVTSDEWQVTRVGQPEGDTFAKCVYSTLATTHSSLSLRGRWLNPEPAGLRAANPLNPQSWNRYAYAANNPAALIDGLGLDTVPCGHWLQACGSIADTPGATGGWMSIDGGPFVPMGFWGSMSGSANGGGESTVQCPDSGCLGVNSDGNFIEYEGIAGSDQGFFACISAGTYDNAAAAAAAAGNCASSASLVTEDEWYGNITYSNGKYSFTLPEEGSYDSVFPDPKAIPQGTTYAGSYHTHGVTDIDYENEVFSREDKDFAKSVGLPFWLITPGGRLEVYNPNPGPFSLEPNPCVASGPAVPAGLYPGSAAVPQC